LATPEKTDAVDAVWITWRSTRQIIVNKLYGYRPTGRPIIGYSVRGKDLVYLPIGPLFRSDVHETF